jgi:hypothetical protein
MKSLSKILIPIASLYLFSCGNSIEVPEKIAELEDKLPERIDYNIHVKPLLSDRCFKCHGPDKNKVEANLQLTNAEAAYSKGKSGKIAIDPGDIDNSEIIKRILSTDPDEVMPTPKSHLTLSDEEKAILIKWVEQGAEYKEHWAYEVPHKPSVPSIGTFFSRLGITNNWETDWAKNEIDNFVLDKLKQNNLKPQSEADRATLLRRVSLDLTGLPPTPEEVDAFLNDKSENAYEKLIDRLLKSPHYGERMAVDWLDVARYADTHGYQDDGFRVMHPYRDWVIRAYNDNLSFDKFVTWQLAGDMIEKPNRESILATAFNRNHQQSQEGGIVPEEYHTEYVADRVNTFGKAFLGLTTECARCHDHKYDPISAKDYYSLYAFFNNNNEYGQIPYNGEPSPTIILTDAEADKQLDFIHKKLSNHQTNLAQNNPKYQKDFENWLKNNKSEQTSSFKSIIENKKKTNKDKGKTSTTTDINNLGIEKGLVGYFDFEESDKGKFPNHVNPYHFASIGEKKNPDDVTAKEIDGKHGKGLELIGDCVVNFGKFIREERNKQYSIAVWVNNLKAGNEGRLITNSFGIFDGNRGFELILEKNGTMRFAMSHVWPDDCIDIRTKDKLPTKQWTHLAISYDGSSKANGIQIYMNGKKLVTETIADNLKQSTVYGEGHANWAGWNGSMNFGRWQDIYVKDYQVDEYYVFNRKITELEVESLYKNSDAVAEVINNPTRLKNERHKLLDFYLTNFDYNYNFHTQQISDLICEENQILTDQTETMVFKERKETRKSYILNRGAYDAKGEEVTPNTPTKFGKSDYPKTRLGLAQWLLDEDNPLFARVAVNRIWLQFFGNGLVKTQEDFGMQGDLPSHPELLDWLAIQFREDDWDTKQFVKRILMSAAYRQSSKADKNLIERDPDNRLIARGPSYRFSAEQVRDNALASSGLLVKEIGGKSVYPYQPDGIWEALATRNGTTYNQNHGKNLYRRSMYTIWKRSSPPPMMLNFDVPDRSFCSVRRQKTATPLQALVSMNDPQFMEACRVLGERVNTKFQISSSKFDDKNLESSINYVFKAIISRPPRMRELNLMTQLYKEQLVDFQQNPNDAENLLSVGEYKCDDKMDKIAVASMAVVCNTLMNYDEAVMKR